MDEDDGKDLINLYYCMFMILNGVQVDSYGVQVDFSFHIFFYFSVMSCRHLLKLPTLQLKITMIFQIKTVFALFIFS